MNISEFKQAVASFVGRDPDYFRDNADGKPGPDKLLIAINNAKIFLQRQIDFEYAREFVDVSYYVPEGVGEGALLTKAVRHNTSCPVNVKKVVNAYTPHGFRRLLPLRQKTFRGVSDMIRGSYERNGCHWMPDCRPTYANMSPDPHELAWTAVWGHTFRDPIYYQHGRTLYLYPKPRENVPPGATVPEQLPFVLDVVAFLPPYANPTTESKADAQSSVDGQPVEYLTDFILDDCYDYMLWRTIVELNVFLKDEEQVGVSQTKMTEALENIRQWNADLINAGYDIE